MSRAHWDKGLRYSLKKQKGVALMMTIFIFALVSILSVGMYSRQSIFVQTAGNVLAKAQAYQISLATEVYARKLLKEDWDSDSEKAPKTDDLLWDYMGGSLTVPIGDAQVQAQFDDMQGKLNINDIVFVDGQINPVVMARIERLINNLALETIKVGELIDWIDENKQQPDDMDGAEDGEYLSLDPPYLNAGQVFRHLSELLLLPNISFEEYDKLKEFVTVLPQGWAKLNINTAQGAVLQSLSADITSQVADDLITARDAEGGEGIWGSVEEFKAESLLSGLKLDELTDSNLGVRSDFFELRSKVTLSDRKVRMVTVIYRNTEDGVMSVISRDLGQKIPITKPPAN